MPTRCTKCYKIFTSEEIVNASCCPSCGTKSLPHNTSEDIMLPINWHELRILANWACRWADSREDMDDDSRTVLQAILKRITAYRPKDAAALTLIMEFKELQNKFPMEFKELQNKFPSATLADHKGKTIIPPREET
jgi:hypothetical protein